MIVRRIDRAAQGLSKTPLIVVIGRLGDKISADLMGCDELMFVVI